MPKLDPRTIQNELKKGWVWPVYWLHGAEQMKARELLKRIEKTVLGDESSDQSVWNREVMVGGETHAEAVLDAAQMLSLGGGVKFVLVREAESLKNLDALEPLLQPRASLKDLSSVCVFLAKDLDGRKKFSKKLVEQAAVVPCEEVAEVERENWIEYLAKRRGLTLAPEVVAHLRSQDPWSLDLMDQEMCKFEMAEGDVEVLMGAGDSKGTERFLEAFFRRKRKPALEALTVFVNQPEVVLPLLGLLTWNLRQLMQIKLDQLNGSRLTKLSPYLQQRFRNWSAAWDVEELVELQGALAEVDFGTKQTPKLPLGLWAGLVHQFAKS